MPISSLPCNPSYRGAVGDPTTRRTTPAPRKPLDPAPDLSILWGVMKIHPDAAVSRLEDLPNIGRSLAADLRALGIHTPADFARHSPLALYERLPAVMGHRHDPCVLYTFLAARHFQESGEKLKWWEFTAEGKRMLGSR